MRPKYTVAEVNDLIRTLMTAMPHNELMKYLNQRPPVYDPIPLPYFMKGPSLKHHRELYALLRGSTYILPDYMQRGVSNLAQHVTFCPLPDLPLCVNNTHPLVQAIVSWRLNNNK